ncbi:hypothetical protein SLEP1_g37541 [Rubroshorea leprosula]|uniref:RRM domain-containing protein n=1 Tax=Rubroshorea leprosula TaxID=152421 RepID=A0AAV5KUZ1_9ROSI|nr:hypothetical protein SLEP1_g37541 [Rubroshorea leprosula]
MVLSNKMPLVPECSPRLSRPKTHIVEEGKRKKNPIFTGSRRFKQEEQCNRGEKQGDLEATEKKRRRRRKRAREEGMEDGAVKEVKMSKKKKREKKEEQKASEEEGTMDMDTGTDSQANDVVTRVYVGSIPYGYTKEDMRHYCGDCGAIIEVDCVKFLDNWTLGGIAIISFEAKIFIKIFTTKSTNTVARVLRGSREILFLN